MKRIASTGGRLSDRRGRHAHPRCHFLLVGHHPWPPASAHHGSDPRRPRETYDQIIFAEFTHEPAEDLAEGLIEIAPAGLDACVLFRQRLDLRRGRAENGAWLFPQLGAPRTRIVVMEHGYHGDTIGTMSAGERGVFNAAYEPLLFGSIGCRSRRRAASRRRSTPSRYSAATGRSQRC